MTDYKRIRLAKKGYRKLRTADTAQFHSVQKSWLQKKLDEAFDETTVVIIHMASSVLSVADESGAVLVSAAYASRLDNIAKKADLWTHEHMHESLDYSISKCRVICNSCGYMNRSCDTENSKFDAKYIIFTKISFFTLTR